MSKTRLSSDEQFQHVMECRQSGLSDHQWCLENDIKPSTFYTWIQRLKKKGYSDIPGPARRNGYAPTQKQEVVRIDFATPSVNVSNYSDEVPYPSTGLPQQSSGLTPTLEVNVSGINLKVTNEVDPTLLMQTLQMLREFSC